MQRVSAEDNAVWLDFSSQLAQGGDIVQGTPMGGPLQLFMVLMATMMASVSFVAFGGVNEVFVATNSVVYAEFGLAVLAPLALVPLVELRRKLVPGSSRRFVAGTGGLDRDARLSHCESSGKWPGTSDLAIYFHPSHFLGGDFCGGILFSLLRRTRNDRSC